jgi:hypothetical protein
LIRLCESRSQQLKHTQETIIQTFQESQLSVWAVAEDDVRDSLRAVAEDDARRVVDGNSIIREARFGLLKIEGHRNLQQIHKLGSPPPEMWRIDGALEWIKYQREHRGGFDLDGMERAVKRMRQGVRLYERSTEPIPERIERELRRIVAGSLDSFAHRFSLAAEATQDSVRDEFIKAMAKSTIDTARTTTEGKFEMRIPPGHESVILCSETNSGLAWFMHKNLDDKLAVLGSFNLATLPSQRMVVVAE